MAREARGVDISNTPEVLHLVEQARESGRPLRLLRGTKEVARVIPAPVRSHRKRRPPSAADIEAFRASAGSWSDVDTDTLVENIRQSRQSSRPPIEL